MLMVMKWVVSYEIVFFIIINLFFLIVFLIEIPYNDCMGNYDVSNDNYKYKKRKKRPPIIGMSNGTSHENSTGVSVSSVKF